MQILVPRDSYTGLLSGPVAWFAYFLVAYFITGSGCRLGLAQETVAGMNLLRVLVMTAGIVTAVIIVLAGVQAWRQWRMPIDAPEADIARHRFVDLAALLLAAFSLVGTLWIMLTVLINPMC